jgi:type I restriction enzyme S subunit
MTELPKGWAEVRLGDVAVNRDRERVPVNAKDRSARSGDVPYFGAAGQVGWIDRPLFDERLLLLGEDGVQFFDADKTKAYMISGPSWVNNHAHVLSEVEGVSLSYLMHYLNQFDYQGYANGTTRLKLTRSAMDEIRVRLASTAEQARIVAALEEAFSKLDAGEAGLRTVRQLLKRMRDAILAAAVTGRLVPQDPNDTPAAKLLADLGVQPTEGADLPGGWAPAELGGLLEDIEAGKSFATQGQAAQAGEVGVIKVSAMTWGEFRPAENKALPPGTAIDERWRIRAGDLLLSRANTADYVGACVLVQRDHDELILSDKSLRLRTAVGVDRRWLLYALRSRPVREQIERLATGTKESMRNISQAKLRSLRVSLPPAEEQIRIADEVERQMSFLEACERAVDAGLARSAGLRRSVLKAAFEGRLVPQDPSDEPASALLDRVRESQVGPGPRIARGNRRHTPFVESEA